MLNRAVLVVRPKQPFLDWAAQLDDSNLVANEGAHTVYFIPQFDDGDEAQKVLKRVFAEVLERDSAVGIATKLRSDGTVPSLCSVRGLRLSYIRLWRISAIMSSWTMRTSRPAVIRARFLNGH